MEKIDNKKKSELPDTKGTIVNPNGIETKQPIPNTEEVRKSQELLKIKN